MSQEIETTLDESSVTAGAKPAEPMPKLGADGSSLAGVQDLGGPTPQNSSFLMTIVTNTKLSLVVMPLPLLQNLLMPLVLKQNSVTKVM